MRRHKGLMHLFLAMIPTSHPALLRTFSGVEKRKEKRAGGEDEKNRTVGMETLVKSEATKRVTISI